MQKGLVHNEAQVIQQLTVTPSLNRNRAFGATFKTAATNCCMKKKLVKKLTRYMTSCM
jgi:hypothetical protein